MQFPQGHLHLKWVTPFCKCKHPKLLDISIMDVQNITIPSLTYIFNNIWLLLYNYNNARGTASNFFLLLEGDRGFRVNLEYANLANYYYRHTNFFLMFIFVKYETTARGDDICLYNSSLLTMLETLSLVSKKCSYHYCRHFLVFVAVL